jgi:hypothetical protein
MTAQSDELTSGNICILPMVFLDFDSDPTYIWGGVGNLSYNGQTWVGVGDLGKIEKVANDAKGGIKSLTLTLNGLKDQDDQDTTGLTALKDISYRGKSGFVYFGYFEDDGKTMVAGTSPELIYSGRVSHMAAAESLESASVRVTIDSFLALMSRSIPLMLSDDEHQRYFSGDKGYDHKPDAMNKTVYWGLEGSNRISGESVNTQPYNNLSGWGSRNAF